MALPKIDVPIFDVKLYSSDKKVKFRPFTVKEEKLFLIASESDDSQSTITTIKQVLNNCIIDDIDIDSLPLFDIEMLFLNLRARSIGEIVNLKYKCNNNIVEEDGREHKCGNEVEIGVNVLEIVPESGKNHTNKIEQKNYAKIIFYFHWFSFLNKIDKTDEEQRTFLKITANWTVEDLNKDIIFPIHRPSHWLLCVISKNRKCISLIDHLYGDSYNEYYLAIKQWYRTLQVKIVGDSEPGVIWSKKLHKDYSMCKQTDSSSCGPLASMTAAHYIFSGEFPTSSINFSQNDVPNLREYMLWMILNLRETEFSSIIVIEDDVDLIEIIDQISRLERQEDTDISKLDEKHIEDNSSI